MGHRHAALILAALVAPAHAEPGAFCELTPCVPGPVTRTMLTKDLRVGKLTCKHGLERGVDAKQRIVFCTTARPATVDGLEVAADAYTLFHPNGRIYQTHVREPFAMTLADATTVQCGAGLVALHDSGRLRYCTLAADRAGTPKPRRGEGISFHPDGRVATMTLDAAFSAAGLALPAGAFVAWEATGALSGGYLRDAIAAAGLSIRYDFALHPNGTLRGVELAAPAKLQGHDFPERAKLQFRSDGTLETVEYVSDHGFLPHGEQWSDTRHVTFDRTGTVTSSHIEHWQSPVGPKK